MTEAEEKIVEGCRRGDSECQKQLYLEFGPMIKGICTRYTADSAEAEDLFHDVFVFILTHFDRFENITSLGGWLRRITINKSIDYVRKKQLYDVEPMSKSTYEFKDEKEFDYAGISLMQLLDFVNKLPDKYRVAFNLYAIDDIPQEKISKIMGETPTNVRTLISRAKGMLRKQIDNYMKKDNFVLNYEQK